MSTLPLPLPLQRRLLDQFNEVEFGMTEQEVANQIHSQDTHHLNEPDVILALDEFFISPPEIKLEDNDPNEPPQEEEPESILPPLSPYTLTAMEYKYPIPDFSGFPANDDIIDPNAHLDLCD